jgi:undecaprenyl-diphosphatase
VTGEHQRSPPAPRPRARSALERRAPLLVGVGLALALVSSFVALSEEVAEGDLAALDLRVLVAVAAIRSPPLTAAALDVTALGSPVVLTLVTALLTIGLWRTRRRRDACTMLAAAVGAAVWTSALKRTFGRHRPADVVALAQAVGASYPSGHALASAAVYGTAALLLATAAARRADRLLIGASALLLLAAIGASRVYLGVHFPSDVLAGECAGAAWALLVFAGEHRHHSGARLT